MHLPGPLYKSSVQTVKTLLNQTSKSKLGPFYKFLAGPDD